MTVKNSCEEKLGEKKKKRPKHVIDTSPHMIQFNERTKKMAVEAWLRLSVFFPLPLRLKTQDQPNTTDHYTI